MEIVRYIWGVVDSNSWLVTENNKGILIDAVDNKQLYDTIKKLDDLTIILTHSHFDHIIGLNRIRDLRPDAIVISSEKCSKYLGNIYRNMSSSATVFMKFYEKGKKNNIQIEPFICKPADKVFVKRLSIDWCGHRIKLCAVHGHSDDGLLMIMDEEKLFSGDTLLHTPTVTRFPTGSIKAFWMDDIKMLRRMKEIKSVYPGHGNVGLIENMLAINNDAMPRKYRDILEGNG